MAHDRMRTFNKHVTNRILRGFASISHGPFAVVRHVGRRSGRSYETTIMVWPLGEDFVIALTYGPEVDWYRNLLACGRGTLLWHGRNYTIGQPGIVAPSVALPAFPLPIRRILERVGVRHFVRVTSVPLR